MAWPQNAQEAWLTTRRFRGVRASVFNRQPNRTSGIPNLRPRFTKGSNRPNLVDGKNDNHQLSEVGLRNSFLDPRHHSTGKGRIDPVGRSPRDRQAVEPVRTRMRARVEVKSELRLKMHHHV